MIHANLLLYSEERIIDMALQNGFESQEAFTRAEERYDANEFGTVIQQFQAGWYQGKRMRFSGVVRTEEVTG